MKADRMRTLAESGESLWAGSDLPGSLKIKGMRIPSRSCLRKNPDMIRTFPLSGPTSRVPRARTPRPPCSPRGLQLERAGNATNSPPIKNPKSTKRSKECRSFGQARTCRARRARRRGGGGKSILNRQSTLLSWANRPRPIQLHGRPGASSSTIATSSLKTETRKLANLFQYNRIELLPMNPDYAPIPVAPHEGPEMVVVGEWLASICLAE